MSQGSILGPLLFLLCVNDLPEVLLSECKLFVDDVKIYCPFTDPSVDFEILQEDLSRLFQWSSTWQLGLSRDKCSLLHVNFVHESWLRTGDEMLRSDNVSVRHLGVIISGDLSWSEHCSAVAVKTTTVVNCILRTISYGSISLFRMAFVVYCRPILEYCATVWSPSKKADIDCIEQVQRYFTRVAFPKCFPGPYSPDYSVRLRIFGLQSLEYRRAMFDLYLCYKIVNGSCDIGFHELFS